MSNQLDHKKREEILGNFTKIQLPAYFNIIIVELGWGEARLRLPFSESLTQKHGFIHGGAITALCDTAVGVALATLIDSFDNMVTIELNINFIAPADGDLVARAIIVHKGRTTAVGEVEARKADDTLVAKGLITYHIFARAGS